MLLRREDDAFPEEYEYFVVVAFEKQVDIYGPIEALGGEVLEERVQLTAGRWSGATGGCACLPGFT
jgi:hypothetical protein